MDIDEIFYENYSLNQFNSFCETYPCYTENNKLDPLVDYKLLITDMNKTISNLRIEINNQNNIISNQNKRIHKLLINIENNSFDSFSVGIFIGIISFYIPYYFIN